MHIDTLLQPGAVPWSPNQDVFGLNVWNMYDYPLTGTFRTAGAAVLFTVVSDFEGHMSLWAYTALSDAEADKLAGIEFKSVADMHAFVHSFFRGRLILFAMAAEGRITRSAAAEEAGELSGLAIRFLNVVVTSAGQGHGPETELRIKLAQAATAAAQLVDA